MESVVIETNRYMPPNEAALKGVGGIVLIKNLGHNTCHDCGLENLFACEESNVHVPANPDMSPCKFCLRNALADRTRLAVKGWHDFYSEKWVSLANGRIDFEEVENADEQALVDVWKALPK